MYRKLVNTMTLIFSPGLTTAVGQSALLGVSGYFAFPSTQRPENYILYFLPVNVPSRKLPQ